MIKAAVNVNMRATMASSFAFERHSKFLLRAVICRAQAPHGGMKICRRFGSAAHGDTMAVFPDAAAVQELQSSLQQQGVQYALASYVDIHGISKSKMVPLEHLSRMVKGSELCTGAALDGVPQDVSDEEVSPVPDIASTLICPWGQHNVAWMASDLYCHGTKFEPCSRNILKRVLEEASRMGYRFDLGIEPEFFLLKNGAPNDNNYPVPIGDRDSLAKPAYDVRTTLDSLPVLHNILEAMKKVGFDVYSFDHEDGNGQFEIDFKFTEALEMADRFVFFRLLCTEVAHETIPGAYASFMPKPFADRAGSGAHYNMNLADKVTGKNLFKVTDKDQDPYGCEITELGYHFIGGIQKHLPAICAVVAPTVNSYKRLIKEGSMSGYTWAPVFACYGNNNRTNAIRIPLGGGRVELRAADSSNNPYLGAALVLAAGLEGVREKIDPGPPHVDNMYLKSPEDLRDLGVDYLPRTLSEAVEAFEEDPLVSQVFGDLMKKTFVDFKRDEWASYMNHVSDWERNQYLKLF